MLWVMDALQNNKLIHQSFDQETELQITLFLDESSREYILAFDFIENVAVSIREMDLLVYLTEIENYYQRLITPPIVAALQKILNRDEDVLRDQRSAPGLAKLNGRSRVKLQASGAAVLIAQLFRLLHPQETYGVPIYAADSELGGKVKDMFFMDS